MCIKTPLLNRAIAYLKPAKLDEPSRNYELSKKASLTAYRIYYGLGGNRLPAQGYQCR